MSTEFLPSNEDETVLRRENELYQESYRTIQVVSDILEDIIKLNQVDTSDAELPIISLFSCEHQPSITIKQYMQRIMYYTKPEPSTIILSLIYIDQICENSTLKLNRLNIYRFILLSLLTAIKYNEDDYFSNDYYAQVGGVSLNEINMLEYSFLYLLDFKCFIDNETYENYERQIKSLEN